MTHQYPPVRGFCPACGGASLFLGASGYITCSRLECPNPEAATNLLESGMKQLTDHIAPAPTIGKRWQS